MEMQKWNSETTIKFIKEFKSHPCLWNHKSPSYKSKRAKEAAYQKVADAMNITGFGVPELKKKMRILRSTYYQEKKKIKTSLCSGSDRVYVPNLPWYKDMDSLLDVDETQAAVDSVCENSTNSQPDDHEITIYSFAASGVQETESENVTHETTRTSVSEESRTKRSRPTVVNVSDRNGIFSAIAELKKLHEIINKDVSPPTQEDQFDVFGKSVALQLRALSYERSMMAQARIQNVLSEISIEDYKHNVPVCVETSPD